MSTSKGTRPTSADGGAGPLALEVRGLGAGYGDTSVLRNVSVRVPEHSVVALLGSNGAGKTTLLRTISGFLRPAAGTLHLAGTDITQVSPAERARLGLVHVPEGRGIYRSLTVKENLVVQAAGGPADAAIERAAAAFPILGERLRQKAGTLSGGQQQMLALAAAYVRDPSVILVDEASLGLAPIIVDEIFEFLASLAAGGTAILLVDQFANRALRLAQTAYVLRKGEIAFDGNAADLLDADLFSRYLGTAGA